MRRNCKYIIKCHYYLHGFFICISNVLKSEIYWFIMSGSIPIINDIFIINFGSTFYFLIKKIF